MIGFKIDEPKKLEWTGRGNLKYLNFRSPDIWKNFSRHTEKYRGRETGLFSLFDGLF